MYAYGWMHTYPRTNVCPSHDFSRERVVCTCLVVWTLDRSEFNETKMLQFSFPLAEFLCFRSQEFLLARVVELLCIL